MLGYLTSHLAVKDGVGLESQFVHDCPVQITGSAHTAGPFRKGYNKVLQMLSGIPVTRPADTKLVTMQLFYSPILQQQQMTRW